MIREAIDAYGSRLNKAFDHDRKKSVGASEIGLCARRVHWAKHSVAADEQPRLKRNKRGSMQARANWGAHVRGTVIEEQLWLPAMRKKFGKSLLYAGEEQVTLFDGSLSGTPDGLLVDQPRGLLKDLGVADIGADRSVVVECKSIDPRVNLVEEKSENAFQVQVQMGLFRTQTRHQPLYAVISYVDASFWHDVAQFVVKFDPDQYEAAKRRAAAILHGDLSDNRPDGWIAGGKECEWCPFFRRCSGERNAVPPDKLGPVDPQFAAEIADMCREKSRLDLAAKQAEDAAADAQDRIRARLKERGVNRVPGVVRWFSIKGRDNWDNAGIREAARAAGVDVDAYVTAGEPTSRLNIDKKVLIG